MNHFASDLAGHGRPALPHFADSGHQFFRRTTFQKIAARACAQGFEDAVGVFVNRHHYDLGGREELLKPGRAFDPGDVRELNVHQDDIRLMARENFEGLLGGGAKTDTPTFGRGMN